ncbi:MAG: nucleoside kinase [Candidatus Cloacimonetes bacterium]|nr:nucleoside kinase [Candidatus Cloacimonadota bacterium]
MIRVDLRINRQYVKTVNLEKPVRVSQLAHEAGLVPQDVVIYKRFGNLIPADTVIDANCRINCVTYDSFEGHLIYQDTTIFILMKAFYNLYSNQKTLLIEHSAGDGIFCEILKEEIINPEIVNRIKQEMENIIASDLPIERISLPYLEAYRIFEEMHRDDVIGNLNFQHVEVYHCSGYYDYYLRTLGERTGFIRSFDIIFHSPGFILRFPRRHNNTITDKFILPRKLFETHQEHDKWLSILRIHNASALNRAISNYEVVDLIQVEEALHENKIVDIANKISWNRKLKIVLIAGPTASGKTTFAKRLSIQLRVNGIQPRVINLDDYFLPRDQTPRKENGDLDFERIESINLELLNQHLNALLTGKEIILPKYKFVEGLSVNSFHKLALKESEILIMEGIHGLNDRLTASVPFNQKVRIYVSALNNLNIDNHNRIRTSDSRKIRRIIRDHNFRGHSAEQTLEMWDSVREGENENIFPFQENADYMFNSILTYELGVLKKYIVPLLKKISPYSPVHTEADNLLELFCHIENIEDHFVPSNSILREFIGGSIFKY